MMKPAWLIEDGPFDEDHFSAFVGEVRCQGMECRIVKYNDVLSGKADLYGQDECVIVHGSIRLMRYLRRDTPWIPGAWCSFDNYKCSTYFAHWGKHLFNGIYTIIPIGEALRMEQRLFTWFEQTKFPGQIFVRPNSGAKPFTGQVVKRKEWGEFCDMASEVMEPHALIVVSSVKSDLSAEYRFVVADGQVIAATQYLEKGEPYSSPRVNDYARALAVEIASGEFRPDPMYTIDIGEMWYSPRKAYLIEVNSFSCAGMYACNPRPIIESAIRQAELEWQDSNDSSMEKSNDTM